MDKENLIDEYYRAVVGYPPPYDMPSIQDLKAGDKIRVAAKDERDREYVIEDMVYELYEDPRWCGKCFHCRMKGWAARIKVKRNDWCVSCGVFFTTEDRKVFKEILYPERESGERQEEDE